MGFYKRNGDELLHAPNSVHAPGFLLLAEDHATYTYPVEGWYWFDTLDAALDGLKSTQEEVTMRQARLALYQTNKLDQVEAAIAASDKSTQIIWASSSTVRRDNPLIIAIGKQVLGMTDLEIDQLFQLATTL